MDTKITSGKSETNGDADRSWYVHGLDCLYGISKLMNDPHLSMQEVMTRIAALLPSAYPGGSGTGAKIRIGGKDYCSDLYSENGTCMETPICVDGNAIGFIRISVAQRKESEYPAAREERHLLETVANDLGVLYEQRSAEQALGKMKMELNSLFDSLDDFLFIADPGGKLIEVNGTVTKRLGYGFDEIRNTSILELHVPDQRDRLADAIRSIKAGEPTISAVPLLTKDGGAIPVYTKFTRSDYHGETVVVGISRDITTRVEVENRLNETLRLLRKTLGGAIQSIAEAVEVRDPYTAGHQMRVANLGRAIATKMDLSKDIIEGIRIAGRIHDIGKIAIPAEILSKSTSLLDIEYEFIKRHPNVGFQILSTIEFPWPVAAMVYQHHERVDGSGYPLGLDGSMMLIESKVLAVADVVEAMATHRPYRPSLGLQTALEEITKNSGIIYDREVVRACIAVINEDGFNLYDETYRWRPF